MKEKTFYESGFSTIKVLVVVLCSIVVLGVILISGLFFVKSARTDALDAAAIVEARSVVMAIEKIASQSPDGIITESPTPTDIMRAGAYLNYEENSARPPSDNFSTLVVFTPNGYVVTTVSLYGKATRVQQGYPLNNENKNIPLGYPNSPAGQYAQSISTFSKVGTYTGPDNFIVFGF